MIDRNHPHSPRENAVLVALIGLIGVLVILALISTQQANSAAEASARAPAAATEHPAAEICFPKAAWSAIAEDRPCYLIERPQEDGSGSLRLGTVGADAAVCAIPNVQEEQGHFAVQCHRVRNR
jgi:hypothetical protein